MRGNPKEEVEALADEVKFFSPGASLTFTEELRALGDGAKTREL